jgi:hypothetical protein
MYLAMLGAPLQLVPMLGLGFAIQNGQRWARWMALAFPVVVAVAELALVRYPVPRRGDGLGDLYGFVYYSVYDQRYHLPFALILAGVVVHGMIAERL